MKQAPSEDQLAAERNSLDKRGWRVDSAGTIISKSYAFKNFSAAFGWMTRAALLAEKLNHHPDWSNSYNQVHVSLTTHSAGGLTDLDFSLARQLDQL
ncbi:MAG: 4a-hydroxytetrahydrobiopterin dehydratase [Rhodobacteraceae bacterium]|nr:4a-hydroxytetrahydrobiopterin dehydratase [Paracoccaceae bacterium]MCY4198002.1 4a-hydroxytetrahydrobiopterin dehydratase [Paracoccaceae bacterium]MCY4327792.1 4a-hydroxytetrahydrobiopterin dehydratase [Paracoccaceae bacterium]